MTHISLDIETLATGPDAVVVTAGLVTFRPESGEILNELLFSFDVFDQMRRGRQVYDATRTWWGQNNLTLDPAVFDNTEVLQHVYDMLREADFGGMVWGFSSTFDNVILKSLFETYGVGWPLSYRADGCGRTLLALCDSLGRDIRKEFPVHTHDALDDARLQARMYIEALNFLQSLKSP